MADGLVRNASIFVAACACGVASGLFGIGGGVLLVPFLALFFAFGQHRAQGTSLIALVPPTGLLAFFAYARAGYVSWKIGLLLIPGIFVGGVLGGSLAKRSSRGACGKFLLELMFVLGVWQAAAAWWR